MRVPFHTFSSKLPLLFHCTFRFRGNQTGRPQLPEQLLLNKYFLPVFGESLSLPNNASDTAATINKRRDFLLRHNIALWDVLASCDIQGAADSSIKNARPNDFSELFEKSKIRRVFCTGKTSFNLWKKLCAEVYEERYGLICECLPSTSPANAAWSLERLVGEYKKIILLKETD